MRIRFGAFTIDSETRQLLRERQVVRLSPKAFELLVALIEARPAVLSKAQLQQRLWPGTFVVEANLSNLIAEVRAALSDHSRAPRFVRTVHGFGYAFCAAATVPAPQSAAAVNPRVCVLSWGRQRFQLHPGEYILGRDADVDIRLNASTISRRHARLTVDGERLQLEDLGSKNGTFHRGTRVTTAVRVDDGDILQIGRLAVTVEFRKSVSTETIA